MTDLQSLIAQTEQQYGLPPGILAATAQVESAGNPQAVSPKGALGLMQIMPTTAKALGVNPLDPVQAVQGAGKLWAQNLKAAGGDIDKAAMMYNGGPKFNPNNPETQAYPSKLAAALPAGSAPQQAPSDPIEAALSGSPQPASPAPAGVGPSAAPADPKDPIESALTSGPQDYGPVDATMRQMFHGGASTQDIVAYGRQHGVDPDPTQIDTARKNGSDVQFVQPQTAQQPDQSQQPQQPPQTNQALGFLEGLAKPLDNAATWLEHGADYLGLAKPLNDLSSALGLAPSQEAATATHQDYFNGQQAQGQAPGKIGEFLGSAAGTLPAVLATKNPWIAGGLSGALTTDDPNNLKQTAIDAGIGALGGKLIHGATSAVSGAIAPQVSKAVSALNDLGVQMTPGQIMGGALKRIEDASTSIPLIGDLVKNAQRRSVLSLNNSAINSVLAPLKQSLPDGMEGREAVDYADKAVSGAYNSLLPQLQVKVDKPFIDNVGQILNNANELPADRAAQVQRIIRGNFLDQFNRPGLDMPGDTFKTVDAKLGQLSRDYSSSGDPEQRQMGSMFRDAQGELRGLLARSNPDQADQLSAINQAHANLVRVEGAAGSAGAKGGVFTPAQLASAVKRYDSSARDKAYATGKALLQNVSDPANEVLPQSLPDSGTPYRTVGAYLLGGGLAHVSPWAAPAAAPIALYTKLGQKAFQSAALAPRGPAAQAVARALTKLKAPLAVAGGGASAQAFDGR